MIYTDEFEEAYKRYPKSGEKMVASQRYAKLSTSDKALIKQDDVRMRYKDRETQYIPNFARYLLRKYWLEPNENIQGEKAPREPLKTCNVEGCSDEVHGPTFCQCIDHLKPPETEVLKIMRKHYRDSGMIQKEGESNREHSLRLRKQYMGLMFDSLHPPIKDMDKFK